MAEADLAAVGFPHAQLAEALDAVVVAAGLGGGRPPETPVAVPPATARAALVEIATRIADRLGVELEELTTPADELGEVLARLGPGLVELPGERPAWLAVIGRRGRELRVIDATHATHDVPIAAVVAALTGAAQAEADQQAARLATAAGLAGRRAVRAHRAVSRACLADRDVEGLWMVRSLPGQRFVEQASRAGLIRRAALLVLVQLGVSLLWLAAWWLIGRLALGGGGEPGWLLGWAICLATLVPARAIVAWLQLGLAVELGALLRRRLLAGALALDPDRLKREGLGRSLGQVLECEALESVGAAGSLQVLLAGLELVPVPFVLSAGAGGAWHAGLLALWLVPLALAAWRQLRAREAWTETRVELSDRLVENMVGHRTRLAQLPRERWHLGEDRALAGYHEVSRRLDRSLVALLPLLSRGWVVVGIAALLPAIAGGASPASLIISIGAVLYAAGALERLAGGLGALTAALDAWRRVGPLFAAAADAARETRAVAVIERPAPAIGTPILEAHKLSFGYRDRAPLLSDLDLAIRVGDRVLLEGSSGSGKSTLAALLAAQRRPSSGLVLFDQLDVDTVGPDRWRRRVALVPQFHENHVIGDSFLFNLLMARAWPPSRADVADARAVCDALGLDRLLEAMPAGLLQVVGDSGWTLSHGERSRLFLARALLQGADVVILDESLAALDPELLDQVGRAVLERAPTLVVIAHP